MKRYWYLTIIIMAVSLGFAGFFAYGQTFGPDLMYVYNSSGTTLLGGKFVKLDTTWTQLGLGLDTTQYLHQWTDTSASGTGYGNCSTYVGSDQLKGLLSDTLDTKTAGLYQVKGVGFTAASGPDCVFVYGWGLPYARGFYSRTDSAATTDTLIFATTTVVSNISKYAWQNIDSVRIRTANAGLDCVRIMYRGYHSVTNADSLGIDALGVVVGNKSGGAANTTGTTKDSIASAGWGYVATSGVVRAWANGAGTAIETGDMLFVGGKYMAHKLLTPVADTVRTVGMSNKRYLKGARAWDDIQVTPIRGGSNTADTLVWGAKAVTDSLYFMAYGTAGVVIPATTRDTLMYQWTPRGFKQKGWGLLVGRALEACNRDSIAILIYLGR